ncbi:16S rRNA (guanine(527)-N(7))-methyltransferase RsmG [Nitriliruptor alkaliphilus]|uniref:16S rRNA (guanine(527)-N(7))-methyltransferase RsmG n=1 Tax=Nitriliruptor alkaliphilus TaxID=427918 RepID=UPI000698A644|nr:16S rRNA (guanine(527)-N(7))-methyltransferase RsmG [Nitriliruptor alkaliphilus]
MDLHPDALVRERLTRFAALVRASEHNLVSRRAREELESRHLPECVRLADVLPRGEQRVLDIGSGGGFPGMVLAIVRPDLEVHLLDATAKKTAFLAAAAQELGVHVTVHTGRAEELVRGASLAGGFDVVTARAVAPLDRLVTWAVPFLRPGGLLYAVKGQRWAEELEAARTAIAKLGASVVATPDDVHTPGDDLADLQPRVVMLARVS